MFLSAQLFAVFLSSLLPRSVSVLFLCLIPVLVLLVLQDNVGTDYHSYFLFFQSNYYNPFEIRQEWLSIAIFKFSKVMGSFQISLFIFYAISILSLSYCIHKSYLRKADQIVVFFLTMFAANFFVNHLNLIRYLTAIVLWLAIFFMLQSGERKIRFYHFAMFIIPSLLHLSTFLLTILLIGFLSFDVVKRRWMCFGISIAISLLPVSIFNILDFYQPIQNLDFGVLSFIPLSKIYLFPILFTNFFIFYFSKRLNPNNAVTRLLGLTMILMPLTLLYWNQLGERLFYFIVLAQSFCFPLTLSNLQFSRSSRMLVLFIYFVILFFIALYKYLFLKVGEYDYQIITLV